MDEEASGRAGGGLEPAAQGQGALAPGPGAAWNQPPRARARSRMPTRPCPLEVSPDGPGPSSVIRSTSRDGR
ncbi:hypothetical protein [Streptosporangium canum]|uniref:hypothetical protein n=1 Tax=Streptosporangium canum TaxID=324952 RepID=UPI0037A99E05